MVLIHCFLENLGTWKDQNKGKCLQSRNKVHAENTAIYCYLRQTMQQWVLFLGHTPAIGLVASIAKAAECYAHRYHRLPICIPATEKPATAEGQTSFFTVLSSVAGHVILYLLKLKSGFRAAEYCTPEGHQLILEMTSKAETRNGGRKEETVLGYSV